MFIFSLYQSQLLSSQEVLSVASVKLEITGIITRMTLLVFFTRENNNKIICLVQCVVRFENTFNVQFCLSIILTKGDETYNDSEKSKSKIKAKINLICNLLLFEVDGTSSVP